MVQPSLDQLRAFRRDFFHAPLGASLPFNMVSIFYLVSVIRFSSLDLLMPKALVRGASMETDQYLRNKDLDGFSLS